MYAVCSLKGMNVFLEVTVLSTETHFSAHLSHEKQSEHGKDTGHFRFRPCSHSILPQEACWQC